MRAENNCSFIGRNTKELEYRVIPNSGKGVTRGTIAVDDPFNKDEPLFLDYVAFGKSAETLVNYSDKGKMIAISGTLKLDRWEDKNNVKHQKHSLIVTSFKILEWKEKGEQTYQSPQQRQQPQDDFKPYNGDLDDSCPF